MLGCAGVRKALDLKAEVDARQQKKYEYAAEEVRRFQTSQKDATTGLMKGAGPILWGVGCGMTLGLLCGTKTGRMILKKKVEWMD